MTDFVKIYSVPEHKEIKYQILELINLYKEETSLKLGAYKAYNDVTIQSREQELYHQKIHNTHYDYNVILDQYAQPLIDEFLLELDLVEDGKRRWWFHEYTQETKVWWHIHPTHFSAVYYLDLPDKRCKTTFAKFEFDVKEGDMIIFPGFLVHNAPNIGNSKKTVVAKNIDTTLIDSYRQINTL